MKRRIDAEGRHFNERWESEHVCDSKRIPDMSFVLWGSFGCEGVQYTSAFDTRHRAKYAKFSPQEKKLIVQELKANCNHSRIGSQKQQPKVMQQW